MSLPSAFPAPVRIFHKTPYPAISTSKLAGYVEGKKVLITGGATGIGLAISKAYASAGATHITIISRRPEPLLLAKTFIESAHPHTKVTTHSASLTDTTFLATLFETSRQTRDEFDILILTSAYCHHIAPTLSLPQNDIDSSFALNFTANYDLVKEFLEVSSTPATPKTIIDISSMGAHIQTPNMGVYAVSKMAWTALLGVIGVELKETGLRTFSVHPGSVWTDMLRGLGMSEEMIEWDSPDLVAQFCVWLVGQEADFLKGRFLWAAWDVDELMAKKEEIEGDSSMLKLGLLSK